MYDVKLDFNSLIMQQHVDLLCYMPVIDSIYESIKQHYPKSLIKTEKECQSMIEDELVIPELKTNLNSDTQKSPIKLPLGETFTLPSENEQSEFKYPNNN